MADTTEGNRVNVLLAEDEESFVDALAIGLSREGFDVTIARDGNEALEMFDRTEPDLVLLDIMLPKLSGIDVCRAIRSRSSVPIIMVTAKGTEIDTVVGLEMGADDYVTKPYRLRELVARMHAVLRRAPRPGPDSIDVSHAADGGARDVGDTKALDVHIKRLRTHVERDPSAPSIITTVRGVGYRFEVPAEAGAE